MTVSSQSRYTPRTDGVDFSRATGYLSGGWCPWPHLVRPADDVLKADRKAMCPCSKRVRITAGGLYAHHKFGLRPTVDDLRAVVQNDRTVNLTEIQKHSAGWAGTFRFTVKHWGAETLEFVHTDDSINGGEPSEVAQFFTDGCAAKSVVSMLNAVPALLAEVARLRVLGIAACDLVGCTPEKATTDEADRIRKELSSHE